MVIGAHSIIYSKDAEADRALLRDVLKFPNVDVGGGWLIFGLPPAEIAVHPSDGNDVHELYLMCDDVDAFVADMKERGVECGALHDQPWGRLTQITLPGGGKLGVYQPRHARPPAMGAQPAARKPEKKAAAKKPATKKTATKKTATKKTAPRKPAAKKPAAKKPSK